MKTAATPKDYSRSTDKSNTTTLHYFSPTIRRGNSWLSIYQAEFNSKYLNLLIENEELNNHIFRLELKLDYALDTVKGLKRNLGHALEILCEKL